jgi:hypothetical protein
MRTAILSILRASKWRPDTVQGKASSRPRLHESIAPERIQNEEPRLQGFSLREWHGLSLDRRLYEHQRTVLCLVLLSATWIVAQSTGSGNAGSGAGHAGTAGQSTTPGQTTSPGNTSPAPGSAAPTPGTAAPTPGTAAPTPGTASPNPGTAPNTNGSTPQSPNGTPAPGTTSPGSETPGSTTPPPVPNNQPPNNQSPNHGTNGRPSAPPSK